MNLQTLYVVLHFKRLNGFTFSKEWLRPQFARFPPVKGLLNHWIHLLHSTNCLLQSSKLTFRRTDLWILCVEPNCQFFLSAAVIGLAQHLMNVLRISNLIVKLKINSLSFIDGFIVVFICWENTRKACKSLAWQLMIYTLSHVLPTSHVVLLHR